MRQNYSPIVHNYNVITIGQVLSRVSDQKSSFILQEAILSKDLVENCATHVSINSAVVKGGQMWSDFRPPQIGTI